MKIACLYFTHKNSQCLFNLETLINHINSYKEHQINIYIYNNNEELNNIIYHNNYCEFSFENLQKKLNYIHKFDDHFTYIGNCQLPLIDLYINHPEYDRFIFYEDDVAYLGNENMFKLFDFNNDIIFSNTRCYNKDWCWYTNTSLHNLNLPPFSELLNIYSLQPDVIKSIYDFMLHGKFGHHEYLINSFIMANYKSNNWSIAYLEGNNDFKVFYHDLNFTSTQFIHPIKNIKDLENYYKNIQLK